MPTKAQLARWRGLEIPFDSFYDTIAKDDTLKRLEIKYVSSSADKENYLVNFEIIAENLDSDKAQLFVKEMNVIFSNSLVSNKPLIIAKAIKTTYELKISKKVIGNLDGDYENGGFEFKGFITCDGLSAETKEFKLSNLKKESKEKKKESINETCFCNRDFKVSELKNIVIQLRKADSTGVIQTVRDKTNTKNFAMGEPVLNEDGTVKTITLSQYEELGEEIFKLEMDEVIVEKEANYATFNNELNKAFRNYNIKTCFQKMHFLSQAYHETQRFTSTYEKDPSSSVIGGAFYRGRGLLHLTHKSNYEELFTVGSGEEPTGDRLQAFVPTVATSIKVACQASAWYWKKQDINQYVENNEDAVVKVSASLNYPKALNGVQKDINKINALAERKLYFNLIKPIFKYDEICKNKK
ncbi:hypothetical protein [Flavobacterium sp. UBA7682]|uniref:hypothetical protein n=1 Tax=Flavobacterium sp. UBA7682 TaxID=1946560 RepID=UPI0025B9D23C|nr:hypothetical protein [Flavobacterium sp. UBA7682]